MGRFRSLDEDIHYTDIAEAAHCSKEYARRTVKEVHEGDITDEELEDAADNVLQSALRQFYTDNRVIAGAEDERSEKSTLPVQIDLTADDPFENVDASKREVLLNIFEYKPGLTKADAAALAGASTEYARQTYLGVQQGKYDAASIITKPSRTPLTRSRKMVSSQYSSAETRQNPRLKQQNPLTGQNRYTSSKLSELLN